MSKVALIVDDDDQNLYMLKVLFESKGYLVESATNGKEALDLAHKNPPDIIVSDIMMPVMDGFELCRQWKSDDKLKNILFVFYTATYTEKKDEEFALQLGADVFIQKPADPKLFLETIQNAIDNSSSHVAKKTKKASNDETNVFKLYNERLVHKLEKKMLDLEKEVAERKQAEKSLRESEDKYRTYVEYAPHGIVITDENGKFVDANPMAVNFSGYTREKLLNLSIHDLIAGRSKTSIKKLFEALIEKGRASGEASYVNKTGEIRHCIINSVKLIEKGYISFVVDITKQRLAEKEKKIIAAKLQQAQKMESLGTLAGGIAHDFNNILGAIMGHIQLAKMEVKDTANEMDEHLDIALNGVERASELVKQILLFSRIESMERKPVNVNLIINEVYKLLRSSLPTSIDLRKTIETEDVKVLANPIEIHQILMNLCTNASHAIGDNNGEITIGLKTIEDTLHPDGEISFRCEITVEDTGCGMHDTIISKIFDPFFTTRQTGGGTGLGLSVVDGIVRSLGGDVSVNSIQGNGTSFVIALPIITDEEALRSSDSILPSGHHETILYVDDEPDIIKFADNLLTRLGYSVVTKNNGQDAFETYMESPKAFKLVMTDLTMPKMNGAILSEKILNVNPQQKIILTTGSISKTESHLIKRSGVDCVMKKPFNSSILAKTIRTTLDGTKTVRDHSN